MVIVSDGEEIWQYDPATNTYSHRPMQIWDSDPLFWMSFGSTGAGSIEQLLAMMRSVGADTRTVELAGEERVLGRDAYLIEVFPAISSSSSDGGNNDHGVMRFWFDKEYFLLLRTQLDSDQPGEDFELRFTSVRFNGAIDQSKFRFEPPPGATEVPAPEDGLGGSSSGTTSVSGGGSEPQLPCVPDGFLGPAELPWTYTSISVSDSTNETGVMTGTGFVLRSWDALGYIVAEEALFRQRIETDDIEGRRVAVNGKPAWLERSEAGLLVLLWQDGDIVVRLMANRLSEEGLLALANSMQPAGQGGVPSCGGATGIGGEVPAEEEPVPTVPVGEEYVAPEEGD
jgi:outer membrane lipoprotein-sorting protein